MDGEPDGVAEAEERPSPPPQRLIVDVIHHFPEELTLAVGLALDLAAWPPLVVDLDGIVKVQLENVVGPPTHIALVPGKPRHN